jgi:hypothetical protein
MKPTRLVFCCAVMTLVSLAAAPAQQPPANDSVSPDALKALSASMRETLLRSLPDPLFEKSKHWGETEKGFSRFRFEGPDGRLRPRMVRTEKNDGHWRETRIEAVDPEKTLTFEIRNVAPGDTSDTTRFDVNISLKTKVHYHHIHWEKGLKLWDATADARLRLKLLLHCEATARFEKTGGIIPDLVYRLRVTTADVSYDDFKVTHVAGVGGELAEFIGDAARKTVHELKPSLEEKLLSKAEAAIVKAADTKELRIGLQGIKKK